ncbi:MAG: hypothetical protein NVS3B5_17210 [Sphingomicrobium sp.]
MSGTKASNAALWRDPWIAAALLVALVLRIAMARGGLWLDEAWSAVMSNHDNNHPLNSWWLQLVGLGASPLLARALSIACSAVSILPAATFAARRGAWAGRSAASLFALSPMLVLLGSEARGYAPAVLAAVVLIDQLDPTRDGPPPSPVRLAIIGFLGALGHLVMLPAVILVGVWLWLARAHWLEIWPALIASIAGAAIFIGPAYIQLGGLTIGSSLPFAWPGFGLALTELCRLTLGSAPLLLLLVGALVVPPRPARTDVTLWLTLGLGLPLAVLIFHPANSHISRYYILSTPALLWLLAVRVTALARTGQVATLLMAPVLLAMAVTDARLILVARAEPDLPVRRTASEHPGPTPILIGASRLSAMIVVAAAEQRVAVTVVGPACVPADYFLADLTDTAPPATYSHCGTAWALVDYRLRPYPDGSGWALYRRTGLPAPGAVASGPRPAL